MKFQNRIKQAFDEEAGRRADAGEPRLTKTDIWKAAGASSGAATHWFNGSNGMDMATCMKVAPLLRVNPQWLYDGVGPRSIRTDGTKTEIDQRSISWPFRLVSRAEFESLSPAQQFAVEKNFADLVKAFSNKIEAKRKSPITKIEEDLSPGKPYVHKTGIIEDDDVDVINQNHPDRETGTHERRKRHYK